MGKAIIIPDVSFASANLGQVTLTEEIPLRAISIVAPASFTGVTLDTLRIIYNPLNTSERGVTWSITSGSAYATIDASTGVLTVLSGASANNVTIKATSTADSSITAQATIAVTYAGGELEYVDWISNSTLQEYISLPVQASNKLVARIDFSVITPNQSDHYIFGSRKGWQDSMFEVLIGGTSLSARKGNVASSGVHSGSAVYLNNYSQGNKYNVLLYNAAGVNKWAYVAIFSGEQELAYVANNDVFTGLSKMAVFGVYTGETQIEKSLSVVKFYGINLSTVETPTGEATPVMNLKPCKYNGQYGLWDEVNSQFYGNCGGGAITGGNDE